MTTDVDRLCSFDGGGLKRWNYSNNQKEDFIPESITGDLVEISFPQKRSYSPNNPGQGNLEFWPDGNPKRNILFVLKGKSGKELGWEFTPSKNSPAKNAVIAAMQVAIANNLIPDTNSIKSLCPGNGIGYNITIKTQEGNYGAGNPRPWKVTINGKATNLNDIRGCVEPTQNQSQSQPQVQSPAVAAAQNAQAAYENQVAGSDIDF